MARHGPVVTAVFEPANQLARDHTVEDDETGCLSASNTCLDLKCKFHSSLLERRPSGRARSTGPCTSLPLIEAPSAPYCLGWLCEPCLSSRDF